MNIPIDPALALEKVYQFCDKGKETARQIKETASQFHIVGVVGD